MRAVVLRRGADQPELLDVPEPEPAPGEALVRTLRVGIDGTDHEVIAGRHGEPPDGESYHVLGHEAVGVVEDPNGTGLDAGQFVVPTVRREPPGSNDYFARGEPDMAPPDAALECGIDGAHGFARERFTAPAESLVPVPERLVRFGFLVEPQSVTEKALELAVASREPFAWAPESALVLGNGALGLLTTAALVGRFDRVYCLGRRDRPDPTIDLVESVGATYVDSRETPVPEVPERYEPMDLVYEATGFAPHAFEAIEALAHNGVAALLGVPGDDRFEVDGGRLHRELVLGNRAVVGSVNAGRRHFEAAVETLDAMDTAVLDRFARDVYPVEEGPQAFRRGDGIKTAVEFTTP